MGGMLNKLTAKTKTELEKMARDWLRRPREQGWEIRMGWDPKRAEKNDDGEWEITLWIHT